MKVKCKANNIKKIENTSIAAMLAKYIGRSDGEVDLEVGKSYTVYGIEFWESHPWFYLRTDDIEYPKPFSSVFFEIVDNRLSKYWQLSSEFDNFGDAHASLVIEQWAKDRTFYELLVDGDKKTVEIFNKLRIDMDAEYVDWEIKLFE